MLPQDPVKRNRQSVVTQGSDVKSFILIYCHTVKTRRAQTGNFFLLKLPQEGRKHMYILKTGEAPCLPICSNKAEKVQGTWQYRAEYIGQIKKKGNRKEMRAEAARRHV